MSNGMRQRVVTWQGAQEGCSALRARGCACGQKAVEETVDSSQALSLTHRSSGDTVDTLTTMVCLYTPNNGRLGLPHHLEYMPVSPGLSACP